MARVIIKDGTGSDRTVELIDAITVVGRDPANKIVLDDKKASRRHCQFEKTDVGYKLVDLESRNGTLVNDKIVNQALLRPGDRVQVGSKTLVFEDAAFKEPPAEVAARMTPAPAPATPAPAAPEPAKVGAASSRSEGPNATDHGPLAPGLRRRSHRSLAASEAVRERKTLTTVAVVAGMFLFGLLVLIIASTLTGEDPAYQKAKLTYEAAKKIHLEKPYDALDLLKRVPADQGQVYKDAQGLVKKINEDLARQATATTESEQKEFDALYQFCEDNRANPRSYDRMFGMCVEFKQRYPKSKHVAKVEEYYKIAHEGRQAGVRAAAATAEKQVVDSLKANDFAAALRHAVAMRDKVKGDLEAMEKADKLKNDVVEKAALHFQAQNARAQDFKARGKKDEARQVYQDLILRMGDGKMDDLKDYCDIAAKSIDGLR